MSQVYTDSGKVFQRLLNREGGIKTLCFGSEDISQKRKVYAIVCEALKKKDVLDKIFEETTFWSSSKINFRDKGLVYIMVFDMLFGKGIHGGGKIKRVLKQWESKLKQACSIHDVPSEKTASATAHAAGDDPSVQGNPRYVRVNTIKQGWEKIEEQLKEEFGAESVKRDEHVDHLLLLPSGLDLHAHPLVSEGRIILQDKASCFSAFTLNPQPSWHVLDACSAPGNKTSHAAAIMRNKGKLWAFEKDARRVQILRSRLKQAGASCVKPVHGDFLKAKPTDPQFKNVKGILVDPSCSGSGMQTHRLLDKAIASHVSGKKKEKKPAAEEKDGAETVVAESEAEGEVGEGEEGEDEEEVQEEVDVDKESSALSSSSSSSASLSASVAALDDFSRERVLKLARFQLTILSHALSFPSVERVVYSTCSIHQEENEDVVSAALSRHPEFELVSALPQWPRRGWSVIEGGELCVRTDPTEDATCGFFVACFQRKNIPQCGGDEVESSLSVKKRKRSEDESESDEDSADKAETASSKKQRLSSGSASKARSYAVKLPKVHSRKRR